ncbi:MAG: M48 family metallopeptidase [Frankiales bacterium]|nr:M48 family metallopeptidase [Frankiales bacterium]
MSENAAPTLFDPPVTRGVDVTSATAGTTEVAGVAVTVLRSARRRRTISAHREGDRIVVAVPARMSRAEEAQWVERMVRRVLAGERRRHKSDDELLERARDLSSRFLGGRAVPLAVRWVDNQESRWGSCTPADRTIRLSRRLVGMPDYVVDYVLLHELAHLLVPGHGKDFWAVLQSYPRLERARGYLEGVAAAGQPAA